MRSLALAHVEQAPIQGGFNVEASVACVLGRSAGSDQSRANVEQAARSRKGLSDLRYPAWSAWGM